MPKSISQMTAQVEKLQRQIDAAKAKEVKGVVARIQEAIRFYGLTPDDLFATQPTRYRVRKVTNGAFPEKHSKRPVPQAGRKLPAKYADGSGNEWTGRGSTPRWLRDALGAGKTKEDFLLIKS